jgi:hypothetical protein
LALFFVTAWKYTYSLNYQCFLFPLQKVPRICFSLDTILFVSKKADPKESASFYFFYLFLRPIFFVCFRYRFALGIESS